MTNRANSVSRTNVTQHPIPPSSKKWKPKQIIYKKITYSMTPTGLRFFYHPDSHIVDTGKINITRFIKDIFSHRHILTTLPSSSPSPLDFEITGKKSSTKKPLPGYLVFELDWKGNWEFQADVDAVSTGDLNINSVPEYFNLVHVIKPGKTTPGGTPPGRGCNVAYFSFDSPSTSGGLSKPQVDPFNLYATFIQDELANKPPKRLNIAIDPDITNTGGPPPGSGLGGKLPKHRRRT